MVPRAIVGVLGHSNLNVVPLEAQAANGKREEWRDPTDAVSHR